MLRVAQCVEPHPFRILSLDINAPPRQRGELTRGLSPVPWTSPPGWLPSVTGVCSRVWECSCLFKALVQIQTAVLLQLLLSAIFHKALLILKKMKGKQTENTASIKRHSLCKEQVCVSTMTCFTRAPGLNVHSFSSMH